jgi:spore coat polysaccharide biosynthesis protein SpsF (cytidylyltransferase family)
MPAYEYPYRGMNEPFLTLVHVFNKKSVNFIREGNRIRVDTQDDVSKMAHCTYYTNNDEVNEQIKIFINAGYRHPEIVKQLHCYEF